MVAGTRGSKRRRLVTTFLVALSLITILIVPSAQASYRRPGVTRQVDLTAAGVQAYTGEKGRSGWVTAVSADGRHVAFTSPLPEDPADTNRLSDIYVKDILTGKVTLASRGISGVAAIALTDPVWGTASCAQKVVKAYDGNTCTSALSWDPDISSDGRYVTFVSSASNLVPGDTNLVPDIFEFDRVEGTQSRLSVDSRGKESNKLSYGPSISGSGRYVSFTSLGSNLVDRDNNQGYDVFVHDIHTKQTTRVSVDSKGKEPAYADCDQLGGLLDPLSGLPRCTGTHEILSSINSSGRYVAFDNFAANLVDNDTNGIEDVFLRDRKTGKTHRVSLSSSGEQAECGPVRPHPICPVISRLAGPGFTAETSSPPVSNMISSDGRFVAFYSMSPTLMPNTSGYTTEFYVHDRRTRRTERITVDNVGGKDVGPALFGSFSAGGRYATWTGETARIDDPAPHEGEPGGQELYIHDRKTGSLQFVSLNSHGELGKGCNDNPGGHGVVSYSDLTPTGRYAVFASCDTNLADADIDPQDNNFHIFIRDLGLDLGTGGFVDTGNTSANRLSISDYGRSKSIGIITARDAGDEVDAALTGQGANLYGASLAYRPLYEDLFTVIELEYMPQVLPGLSPIFYGLRFEVQDKSYEVRATSLLGGTFGLFDCTNSRLLCTKVADLRGGYGTTGMRVVFSLPLDEIGLEDGGELEDVTAFSGLGSYMTGAAKVLDRVRLK